MINIIRAMISIMGITTPIDTQCEQELTINCMIWNLEKEVCKDTEDEELMECAEVMSTFID